MVVAADYLQVTGLKKMCGRLMIDMINVENCLELLDTAFKYDIKNLKSPCADFFVTNRKEVLEKTENLAEAVSNISPVGLELLGIKLEQKTLNLRISNIKGPA